MNKDTKRIVLWLTAAVVIIIAILVIIFSSGNSVKIGEMPPLTENEWYKGNKDAKVVIVEYSDFQCPACKNWAPSISSLSREFSSHAKFIYRHFPLNTHPNSTPAAKASEAAGLQNKFWEMHDMIFFYQDSWKDLSIDEAENVFEGYAQSLGLDMEKYRSDFDSSAVKNAVEDDLDGAQDAGLNSTPTFFLDGEVVKTRNYEEFRALIRAKIQSVQQAS